MAPHPTREPQRTRAPLTWQQVAAAVYGGGRLVFLSLLASSYRFTRRLVRASRPVAHPWAADVHESTWIAVPVTVGLFHPKILLPSGWREWPKERLEAALAHERTHVERADWAIALW